MNLPLGLVIEGLVAVLLVITIVYCVLLNGRLKRLRADEENLRATIAELLTATEIAERAIHGLKSTSSQCNQAISATIGQARDASADLSEKLHAASAVTERIAKVAGVKEPAKPAPIEGVVKQTQRKKPSQPVPAPQDKPARRLDDAARALQERLQKVAS